MKNIIAPLFLILSLTSFLSCDTEEALAPFVFKSSSMEHSVATVEFVQENADAEFVTLEWEPVDFGPSKTTKYSVEIAAAGTEFAKPMDIVTMEDGFSESLTVGELNLVLARLGFKVGNQSSVDIRVRSWVNYLEAPAVSNIVTVTVVPYLVVFPPLYVIGDVRPGGWGLTNGLELVSHTPGIYEGEGIFLKDGQFRFFYALDWGAEQVRATNFAGGTLDSDLQPVGDNDGNIRFLGLSGTYKIKVDLNTLTITVNPAGPPPPPASLFLVTSQIINLEDAIEFPAKSPGVYENTIIIPKNTKFRFFTELNWTKEKWGFDYFETVDSDLGDSGDDVSNFIFLSEESEYYKITITAADKSIAVVPSAPPFPATLYVNGDPYGWNFANAAVLLSTGVGIYEGMIKVTNGSFRFFSTNNWVQPQWGYDDFTTIPGVFTDGGGGDRNLVHAGGTRYYKITVSLINKTITLADPVLYVIGDDQGWNLGNAFALTWQSGGTFTGTTTFTNNSAFRFFIKSAWGQPKNELNFSSFTTVDSEFTNAGGGDQNLRFNGTTGSHTITVNLIDSSVVIN